MKTLGRNIDNDLYIAGSGLAIVSDAEAQCAIIESIISTQRGELQFDDNAGIDYFGTVFRNPSYIPVWASQVQSQIEALSWVASVDDFTYNFDRPNSTLIWSMTVVTTSGERLDLKNKQIKVGGVSSVNVKWNDIYDKPDGASTVISSINTMADAANGINELTAADSMAKVKEALNAIMFDSMDEEAASKMQVTFVFSGYPIGIVLNCEHLKIKAAENSSIAVSLSDGTATTWDVGPDGYATVTFPDAPADAKYKHTFLKSGGITMTLRGQITGLGDGEYPIFLNNGGTAAFPYLSEVKIGSGIALTEVNAHAFEGFVNLETIQWNSASQVSFGAYAFANCASLNNLNWLPKTLSTNLQEGCFSGCSSLVDISGLAAIESDANEILSLPKRFFYGCSLLPSVAGLPPNLTALGEETFASCSRLKNLDGLPDSIESFGARCFANCTGITKILYLPDSLTAIGAECFKGDTSLVSAWLPNSITTIGDEAFYNCTALTNVLCEANYSDVSSNSIFNQNELSIFVPPGQKSDYEGSSNWKVNPSYVIREYGTITFSADGMKAGTAFLGNTGTVTSESIWSIDYGDGAKADRFENSISLIPGHTYAGEDGDITITLLGYIKEISGVSSNSYPLLATKYNGFAELTAVTMDNIPLEKIGDYCFSGCTKLASVDLGLPETAAYCLGEASFANCLSLTSLDWLTTGLGKLVVDNVVQPAFGEKCFYGSGVNALNYANENVTSLPAWCFRATNITSLNGIDENVESLGEFCFAGCSNLVNIEAIAGTKVTELPAYCFYFCNELQSIAGIGWNKIASIGEGCFAQCRGLNSIGFIANTAVSSLPKSCFAGCSALTSLDGIEDKITSLGESCFSGCSNLQNIAAIGLKTDPNNGNRLVPTEHPITVIPPYCFAECGSLKSLVGAVAVTQIGDYAFSKDVGLVTTSGLGPVIASIGVNAFYMCTGLQYVSMVALTPPTLNSTSFASANVQNIPLYVRAESISRYAAAPYWTQFASISSRAIKLSLSDIGTDTTIDGSKSLITSTYAWYADFGDDAAVGAQQYYALTEGTQSLPSISYNSRGARTITLYGDITGISADSGFWFLTKADETKVLELSGVDIGSAFLQTIGNKCFEGFTNLTNLSISMKQGGTIGDYTFKGCTGITTTGCDSTVGALGQYAFKGCTQLSDISGLTSVTSIGDNCFEGDTLITSLGSLTSVVSLGEYAFKDCIGLTTTAGLSNLQTLGDSAFEGCSGLVTVTGFGSAMNAAESEGEVGGSIGENAFKDCPNITAVFMAVLNPPELPANAFTDNVFQNAILYVPAGSNADNETYVDVYKAMPNWNKFQSAQGESHIRVRSIDFTLTDINENDMLVAGRTKITATGTWTIDYGSGEDSYTFGAGETILGSYTFASSGTKVIRISGAVTAISATSDSAYPILSKSQVGRNDNLTAVASSAAMEIGSFGDSTFKGCTNLKSVKTLPSITSIGNQCFNGCIRLEDVSGLSGVTTIGDYAFKGCNSLEDLYGMNSVVTIGGQAFAGCSKLEYIDGLGLNVSEIGTAAFANCTALKEVQMLAAEPPAIAENAFNNVNLATVPLYVQEGSLEAYKADVVWGTFTNIAYRHIEFGLSNVVANSAISGNAGGIQTNRSFWAVDWGDDSVLVGFPGGIDANASAEKFPVHQYSISGDYTVKIYGRLKALTGDNGAAIFSPMEVLNQIVARGADSTLEDIGAYTFAGASALTTVSLPSVKNVGDYAFQSCSALLSTSGLIGAEAIGAYAFSECSSLQEVVGGPSLNEIGEFAFLNCTSIAVVQMANLNPPSLPYDDSSSYPDYSKANGGTAFVGTPMVPPSASRVPIYVASVSAYKQAEEVWSVWSNNISARDLVFHLTGVPKDTTIISGTSYVVASGKWSVTWNYNDTEIVTEEFSSSTRNLPAHTFTWTTPEATRDYTVTLSGPISLISAVSPTAYPFFATAAGEEFPYLTSISCAEGMGLEEIGESAFRGCTRLTKVSGLASVKTIGDYAFYGCTMLSDISGFANVDGGVTEIADYAFAECSRLASLTGLGWVTRAGSYAFQNCKKITSIAQIGALVYSKLDPSPSADDAEKVKIESFFGSYCFSGCSLRMIESQYIRPPSIDETTFEGLNPEKTIVYVPDYSSDEHKVPSIPSASGVSNNPSDLYETSVEAYQHAEVWKDFWRGISVKAYIKITFKIPSTGGTVTGATGEITYTNTYNIDWGDGSSVEVYGDINQGEEKTEQLPDHTYEPTGSEAEYTIKIGGSVKGLKGTYKEQFVPGSSSDEGELSPCFILNITGGQPGVLGYLTAVEVEKSASLSAIGDACFARCSRLNRCVIENAGSLSIGKAAFYRCNILSSLVAADKALGSIPEYAFYQCSNLNSIEAGSLHTISSIGKQAFYQCSSLGDVDFASMMLTSIGQEAFYSAGLDGANIIFPNSTLSGGATLIIGSSAFANTSIASIDRPYNGYGVTLNASAFSNCSGLTSIGSGFLQALGTIPAECFMNCSSLGSTGNFDLSAATHLNAIYAKAFYGCAGMMGTLTIPASVSQIGNFAFAKCGMTGIEFVANGSLQEVPERCFFYCPNLETITISSTELNSIGDYAFACCKQLGNITLPKTVTRLGEGCFLSSPCFQDNEELTIDSAAGDAWSYNFLGWSNLANADTVAQADKIPVSNEQAPSAYGIKSLIWDEDVDSASAPDYTLGKGCFLGCTRLTSVKLPDHIVDASGTNTLSIYTFYGCSALLSLKTTSQTIVGENYLPSEITAVGDYCFTHTKSLKSISIHNKVLSLGVGCFSQSRQFIYYNTMPTNSQDQRGRYYPENANWLGAPKWVNFDDSSISNIGLTALSWSGANSGTISIGLGCFDGCTKLATITTLPARLTKLSEFGFYDCRSISTFGFLASPSVVAVSAIGRYCFSRTGIQNLVGMPSSVRTVGDGAFSLCQSLTTTNGFMAGSSDGDCGKGIFKGCVNLYTIENLPSLAILPEETFMGCTSLSVISLPSSVATLKESCFEGCSSLSDLTPFSDVQNIGIRCFAGLTSPSFTSFNGLQFVNDYTTECFAGCPNLVNINALSIPGAERDFTSSLAILDDNYATDSLDVFFTTKSVGIRDGWQIAKFDLLTRTSANADWQAAVGAKLEATILDGNKMVCKSQPLILQSLTPGATQFTATDFGKFGINVFEFLASSYSSSEPYLKDGKQYTLHITANYSKGIGVATRKNLPETAIYFLDAANNTQTPRVQVASRLIATPKLGIRAFAECPSIEKIDFSSYDYMIGLESRAEGNDPFINIPDKGAVRLIVPASLEEAYKADTYWGQYDVQTPNSITLTTTTPNETVNGSGVVRLASGADYLMIDWGDGTYTRVDAIDGEIDLSTVSHTYDTAGTHTVGFF